jgi:hypothetical protein
MTVVLDRDIQQKQQQQLSSLSSSSSPLLQSHTVSPTSTTQVNGHINGNGNIHVNGNGHHANIQNESTNKVLIPQSLSRTTTATTVRVVTDDTLKVNISYRPTSSNVNNNINDDENNNDVKIESFPFTPTSYSNSESSLKIMTILVIIFLCNIGITFKVLSVLFTTPTSISTTADDDDTSIHTSSMFTSTYTSMFTFASTTGTYIANATALNLAAIVILASSIIFIHTRMTKAILSHPSIPTKLETASESTSTSASTCSSISYSKPTSNSKIMRMLIMIFLSNIGITFRFLSLLFITPTTTLQYPRHHPHIIPPSFLLDDDSNNDKQNNLINNKNHKHNKENNNNSNNNTEKYISNMTLRQFLSDDKGFHLAMGPAFFGYYVYFGALTAFQENVLSKAEQENGIRLLPQIGRQMKEYDDEIYMNQEQQMNSINEESIGSTDSNDTDTDNAGAARESSNPNVPLLKSVAGASAGAMAAVLLASGLNPRESAEFASSMTLDKFADPIGFGGILKGHMFEEIMVNRLKQAKMMNDSGKNYNYEQMNNLQLEEGLIPVAVTVFDLLTMKTKTLHKGCMGRAARASACFPLLFQPVTWSDDIEQGTAKGLWSKLKQQLFPNNLFIDGGVLDPHGLVGLATLEPNEKNKRVVNLVAGSFAQNGPLGPSMMPPGLNAGEVLSISIENAPMCGPHKMANGPRAVQAAMDAVNSVLDVPMYYGREKNHYILNIDAKSFIPPE